MKQKRQEGRRRERAQVKSILAGWCADLSRESRKLRISCFNRNGCNQTLGLRVGQRKREREEEKEREEADGGRLKRVGSQFQVHKRAPSCARTRAPVMARLASKRMRIVRQHGVTMFKLNKKEGVATAKIQCDKLFLFRFSLASEHPSFPLAFPIFFGLIPSKNSQKSLTFNIVNIFVTKLICLKLYSNKIYQQEENILYRHTNFYTNNLQQREK